MGRTRINKRVLQYMCSQQPDSSWHPMTHPDGCREIRAMVLASLPVPPMPTMGTKQVPSEEEVLHETCFSSYDLIAQMLNVAAKYGRGAQESRMLTQWRAQGNLLDGIDALREEQLVACNVWPLFCAYKRLYVSGFIQDQNPDLRFHAWDRVDKHSAIWLEALDHAKGHDKLFGTPHELGGAVADGPEPSYEDLIVRAARRIWLAGQAEQALPVPPDPPK